MFGVEYGKLVDEINRLFEAGYHSDYPPLKELLEEWEQINAQYERYERQGEI